MSGSAEAKASPAQTRLVAVDLDGTLLAPDGTVRPSDIAAAAALEAAGIAVCVCTGRLHSGAVQAIRALAITGPSVVLDGSYVVEPDGTELHAANLDASVADAALRVTKDHDVAPFLFGENQVWFDVRARPHVDYVRIWSESVRETATLSDRARATAGVLIVGSESGAKRSRDAIHAATGYETKVLPPRRSAFPDLWALVLRAPGANKGTGLHWLANRMGISMSEVACVGDWYNDVPMFEVAGRSFVMSNAPPEVKSTATEQLAASCDSGGAVMEVARRLGAPVLTRSI